MVDARPCAPPPSPQILIGIDYGLRRVGVAAGDTLTCRARPLPAIPAHDGVPDWVQLDRLCKDIGPARIVVGCPYHIDGSEGDWTKRVRNFAADLGKRWSLPVSLVDERFTSQDAKTELRDARASGVRSKRVVRAAIDSGAAALILERWMSGEGEDR